MNDLSFYWDPFGEAVEFDTRETMVKKLQKLPNLPYILIPLSARCDVVVNKNILNNDFKHPIVVLKLLIDNIHLSLTDRQWQSILGVIGQANLYAKQIKVNY